MIERIKAWWRLANDLLAFAEVLVFFLLFIYPVVLIDRWLFGGRSAE